jgi:uncharacterized membrane protein
MRSDICPEVAPVSTTKRVFLVLLAAIMVFAGVAHFSALRDAYVAIMPAWLPLHVELVYLTGVLEILFGVGLLIPGFRHKAAWGLVALLILMWPANINQAIHGIQPAGLDMSPTMLWVRVPLQLVFIAWAWWMTRPDRRA